MKTVFVVCKTHAEAIDAKGSDWAKIVKVDGGYMFFESMADYKTWKNQK
jgi:hypothetical protein